MYRLNLKNTWKTGEYWIFVINTNYYNKLFLDLQYSNELADDENTNLVTLVADIKFEIDREEKMREK